MCCIVCRDWELGKLTNEEAKRNLNEIADSNSELTDEEAKHYWELWEKILEDETDK
jgi:hypothetical protein